MKLGVLAVVASLGGLFVLSKTENKASENVVLADYLFYLKLKIRLRKMLFSMQDLGRKKG